MLRLALQFGHGARPWITMRNGHMLSNVYECFNSATARGRGSREALADAAPRQLTLQFGHGASAVDHSAVNSAGSPG